MEQVLKDQSRSLRGHAVTSGLIQNTSIALKFNVNDL